MNPSHDNLQHRPIRQKEDEEDQANAAHFAIIAASVDIAERMKEQAHEAWR